MNTNFNTSINPFSVAVKQPEPKKAETSGVIALFQPVTETAGSIASTSSSSSSSSSGSTVSAIA